MGKVELELNFTDILIRGHHNTIILDGDSNFIDTITLTNSKVFLKRTGGNVVTMVGNLNPNSSEQSKIEEDE